MKIEVSLGEILDRLAILQLKLQNIKHPGKVNNIIHENEMISKSIKGLKLEDLKEQIIQIYEVNRVLWRVWDKIRSKEAENVFDEEFIELSRSVYKLNDRRHAIKREINLLSGSNILEEKQYTPY
jgi:tRNA splicing endonuclease